MIWFRTEIILLLFALGVTSEMKSLSEAPNVVNDNSIFEGANIEQIVNFTYKRSVICNSTYNPKKPNFASSKRRTSEIKCLDYIWTARKKEFEFYKELLCSANIRIIDEFVSGGRSAIYGEFPHMGALGWRSAAETSEWVFKCGATLISHKFMVTAGHCTYVPSRDTTVANHEPEIVKLGDNFLINEFPEENEMSSYDNFYDLESAFEANRPNYRIPEDMKPKYINIKKIVKHDKYDPPKTYNDIALIELTESVQIGALIRPACLWSSLDTSSLNNPSVIGWGVVEPGTQLTTNELQVAEVSFINNEKCDELLLPYHNRNWAGLMDQICAGYLPGGIDTCQGDSGGPLQCKINLHHSWPMYFSVGVTSFSSLSICAQPDIPGVYIRIASFVDWIESIVWPSS